MRIVIKFFHLSGADRKLFFRSWLFLVQMTWLVRFSFVKTALRRIDLLKPNPNPSSHSRESLVRWIRTASRYTPGSTCLSEALAACALLKYYSYPTVLMIGVKKDEGVFAGHAWVECDGKIIIGGSVSHLPLSRYAVRA